MSVFVGATTLKFVQMYKDSYNVDYSPAVFFRFSIDKLTKMNYTPKYLIKFYGMDRTKLKIYLNEGCSIMKPNLTNCPNKYFINKNSYGYKYLLGPNP